jgi:hypothetical protein
MFSSSSIGRNIPGRPIDSRGGGPLTRPAPDILPIRGTPPFLERAGCLFGLDSSGYRGLANFTARIVAEIGSKDSRGQWIVTALRIELKPCSPTVAPRVITVAATSFRRGRWLHMLSPPFVVEPGVQGAVTRAVEWLSGWDRPIPRVEAGPGAVRQLAGRKEG